MSPHKHIGVSLPQEYSLTPTPTSSSTHQAHARSSHTHSHSVCTDTQRQMVETHNHAHTQVHTGTRISPSTSTHTHRRTHSTNRYKQVRTYSGANTGICKHIAHKNPQARVLRIHIHTRTGTNRYMHTRTQAHMYIKVHTHTRTCTSAHSSSLALTPRGELAARQAPCFLLGVHNLSQALIESRVIYNSASPLPEWAVPSCCSRGQGLWPPPPHPPQHTHTFSSHRVTHTVPSEEEGGLSLLATRSFLDFSLQSFSQARHDSERFGLNPLTSPNQHYTAQTLGAQSRPPCLARDSQDLDCRSHVLPELQQEKLD